MARKTKQNNLELKVVNNKEDIQGITHEDKWFKYNENKHRILGCNEELITTVSQVDGFILNTTYNRKEFPKIVHQEKADIAYLLRQIGGEDKLKDNSVWYNLDEDDKRTFWNLNFYIGRY